MSGHGGDPPRIARAILDRLLSELDEAAAGDLDEEYVRFVRPRRGRLRADLWYWGQVLRSTARLLARDRSARLGLPHLLGSCVYEVRLALRVLRRRPAFTLSAVGTLALGLGATTTVFSVVHAVLVRPLPFTEVERLVRPVPDVLFFIDSREAGLLEERMSSFESFAAWGRGLFLFTGDGVAEEVRGARVAWNHFDVLGVDALLGRTFVRADAESDDVVLIAHGLWVRRFGADPAVVGSTVELSGRGVTVIGVLGPDHVPLEHDWQAWRPLPLDPERARGMGLAATGRLRPGADVETASAELRAAVTSIWATDGHEATEEELAQMTVVPLRAWLLGDVRPALVALFCAVGFLLLLSCVNVASLLLAERGRRDDELALRAALGGSRARVAGQLFAEVLVLSLLGGVVAVMIAVPALDALVARLPAEMPRLADVRISGEVALYALAATLGVAVVTSVVPAMRLPWRSLAVRSRHTPGRTRVRAVLVALESGVAVVLVVAAVLMLRTLSSLAAVDTGFRTEGVVTVRPSPPADRYPDGPALEAYYTEVENALARLPRVQSVGAIQFLPMTPGGWWASYERPGADAGPEAGSRETAVRVVRPGYFETVGVRVLSGRALDRRDEDLTGPVRALVNESLAARAFPDGAVLGAELRVADRSLEVVGVVADVRQSDLRTASHPEVYLPFTANPWRRLHLVVRVDGEARESLPAVAEAVRAVDADVALLGPRPMQEVVVTTIGRERLVTMLLAIFGLVGLGLGAVGVYGVASQSVSERRREIGIRLALGAEARGVMSSTIVSGMAPVLVGAGGGLVLALGVGRLLRGVLYGVAEQDPVTLAAAPGVLALVALAALTVPAVRAARLDPVRTLNAE